MAIIKIYLILNSISNIFRKNLFTSLSRVQHYPFSESFPGLRVSKEVCCLHQVDHSSVSKHFSYILSSQQVIFHSVRSWDFFLIGVLQGLNRFTLLEMPFCVQNRELQIIYQSDQQISISFIYT